MTEAWEPPRLSGRTWRVGKAGPEVRWRKESQAEVKRDRSHSPALGRKRGMWSPGPPSEWPYSTHLLAQLSKNNHYGFTAFCCCCFLIIVPSHLACFTYYCLIFPQIFLSLSTIHMSSPCPSTPVCLPHTRGQTCVCAWQPQRAGPACLNPCPVIRAPTHPLGTAPDGRPCAPIHRDARCHPPTSPLVYLLLTIFPAKLTSTKGSTKFFLLLSKPKICLTLSITASSTEEKDMLITACPLSIFKTPTSHLCLPRVRGLFSPGERPWTPQPRVLGEEGHLQTAAPEGSVLLLCPAPNSWFTVPPVFKGILNGSN